MNKPPAHTPCCYIDPATDRECEALSEWRIRHGEEPDAYTESCTAHVGDLLTDAPEHRVYPWDAPHSSGVWTTEITHLTEVYLDTIATDGGVH